MSMPEQMDLETSDVELDVAEQVVEEGEASADAGRVPGPGGVARVFPGWPSNHFRMIPEIAASTLTLLTSRSRQHLRLVPAEF